MSIRQWLYDTLLNDPNLSAVVGDRIFQGESMTSAQITKPYLVYRLGNDTDENFGGEGRTDPQPHRTFFQVYIHDEPGDYDVIDNAVRLIKNAFRAVGGSPEDGIMAVRYLETSRDMDDADLATILRYCRFQFILSR